MNTWAPPGGSFARPQGQRGLGAPGFSVAVRLQGAGTGTLTFAYRPSTIGLTASAAERT